ncbi:MAG: hypothetical protein PHS04_00550 [Tissierellia bacterium]|nr:hypothetical protein [Tissierellia bacterium]
MRNLWIYRNEYGDSLEFYTLKAAVKFISSVREIDGNTKIFLERVKNG